MLSHRVAVPALAGLFLVCGLFSLLGDSVTFDETAHLGAGVSYLERGDFRLNPEHPPLAKMVAAAPLELLSRGGGDYASAAWTGPATDEWTFGFELINGPADAPVRRDPAARLVPARAAMLLLGLALCLAVYGWARELHGGDGALVALALAVTCPTIVAHARLVTTDLPGAFGLFATTWMFWRWTRRPGWGRATALGGALAAALLMKFNALLVVPVIVVLAAGAVAVGRVPVAKAAAGLALALGLGFAGIWAGYGMRYAASPDPSFSMAWNNLSAPPSAAVAFARDHRLLPEAYLFGLAYARAEASGRTGFLDGEESNAGWFRYFPELFLFKTPLAFLALAGWTIGATVRTARGRSFDGWCVALPPLALAAVSIASRFNIGHRHIAAVYPFLCVAAAPAGAWLAERGLRRIAAAALVAGCAVSFVFATPGYLSYFNVLAGGPRGAWRHVVDSNIDWGQDLRRLESWMDARGVAEVDLAYFGTADPRAYGIRFRKVFTFLDFRPGEPAALPEPGHVFAASVSVLQGLFVPTDRDFVREAVRRGWVPRARAEDYVADREARTRRGDPIEHAPEWMIRQRLVTREQAAAILDGLPGGWLARARDRWTPIGRAGDSILIYRVE